MQGKRDMTLDSEMAAPPRPSNTAAGLDASLAEAYADTADADREAPVLVMPDPVEERETVGPVNAAEALTLDSFSGARKLTGTDGAELVVDPQQNAYYFESNSLKPLAALLQQQASAWTPVYSDALNATRAANPAQRLERLRWYAGLIATPGILSRVLDRAGRYQLSRWPETEREFPKHFRIAKEMLRNASTSDEIVTASGMPYDEVVDYINASYAGGRLDVDFVSKPSEGAPVQSRGARLMARLNKPLFVR